MRKYSKFLVIALILVLAMGSFAACGGEEEAPAEEEITVPEDIEAFVTECTDRAAKLQTELEGLEIDVNGEKVAWADEYAKLMESDEKGEYANYDAIMQPLRDFQTAEGAQYVYCVAATDPEDLEGSYHLTVDASEEPEEWGIDYGFEIQFKEAAEGEIAAARSAWQDGDDAWCWSAFAPIKNADGEVVAIVGIDYPAPLIADYPEWDRDNEAWNGLEEEWPAKEDV